MTIESNKNGLPRARLGKLVIDELSIVDRPCQEPATVTLMKRAPEASGQTLQDLAMKADRKLLAQFTDEIATLNGQVQSLSSELAQAKSTRQAPIAQRGTTTMKTLDEALAEIETLKTALAVTEKRASMSEAERLAEIEKSDPVAYKGEVSGITVRKSEASDFAMKLAKAHEAQAVALSKANEAAEVEKAAKQTEILKARAKAELGHLAGTDDLKVEMLKRLDGLDGALEMLKGADDAAKTQTEPKGVGGTEEIKPADPQAELDALVAAETAKGVVKAAATDAVMKTAKGKELYAQIQKAKKAAR